MRLKTNWIQLSSSETRMTVPGEPSLASWTVRNNVQLVKWTNLTKKALPWDYLYRGKILKSKVRNLDRCLWACLQLPNINGMRSVLLTAHRHNTCTHADQACSCAYARGISVKARKTQYMFGCCPRRFVSSLGPLTSFLVLSLVSPIGFCAKES